MNKSIMYVDNDEDCLFSLKDSLEKEDREYQIIFATSGAECLNKLKNNTIPDLILLELMIPDMSGWEIYDKIKLNPAWRNIPIVFLTSRTDKLAKNAGEFLGNAFIQKPYDVQEITDCIEQIL